MRNKITVQVCGNRDAIDLVLPAYWQICCDCSGDGTTCRHVECDGGGFTASEWAEQDDEFREDYLNGHYDRPCPSCDGLGRIMQIDHDSVAAFGGWRQKILYRAYLKQEADSRDIDAIQAAEIRMGA